MTGTGHRADEPRVPAGLRRGLLAGVALAAVVGSGFAWRGQPAGGPARNAAPSAVGEGAWLFQVKGCAACHDDRARGYPDLSDAAEWAGDRQEGMTAEQYLAESILDPGAAMSPQRAYGAMMTMTMPRLNVTDAEVDALVAYLLED